MDLEDGEIEMEDGEIYEDGQPSNSSVPQGFWAGFTPPKQQNKRGRGHRWRFRSSRRFPSRGWGKPSNSRGFEQVKRRNEDKPVQNFYSRSGYRASNIISDRNNPSRESGAGEPRYLSRKGRENLLDHNSVHDDTMLSYRDEIHEGPQFNGGERRRGRDDGRRNDLLNSFINTGHGHSPRHQQYDTYDNEEYDLLIQRYRLIRENLNRLEARGRGDASRKDHPTIGWESLVPNNREDVGGGTLYEQRSPLTIVNNRGTTDFQKEADVSTHSSRRTDAHPLDRSSRPGYNGKEPERYSKADDYYQVHSQRQTQGYGLELRREDEGYRNYNHDSEFYGTSSSTFNNIPSGHRETDEEFIEDCVLSKDERKFIYTMDQENYYGMPQEGSVDTNLASTNLSQRAEDIRLAPHGTVSFEDNETQVHGSASWELQNPSDVIGSNEVSSEALAATIDNKVTTVKKKKRTKSKIINKLKKKLKALKKKNVTRKKEVIETSVSVQHDGNEEVVSDGSTSLDNFISSCRLESRSNYRQNTRAKDFGDNYQLVPMELSGYSSEDKIDSPSQEEQHKLPEIGTTNDMSEDEVDVQLLREQLLRSVATKRLEKAKELIAQNKQGRKPPLKKSTTVRNNYSDKEEMTTTSKNSLASSSPILKSGNSANNSVTKNKDKSSEPEGTQSTRGKVDTSLKVANKGLPVTQDTATPLISFKLKTTTKRLIRTPTAGSASPTSASSVAVTTQASPSFSSSLSAPARPSVAVGSQGTRIEAPRNYSLPTGGNIPKTVTDCKKTSVSSKPKHDPPTLQLPRHDPVVIQVGAESDTDDEEENGTSILNNVKELQGIKGELRSTGSGGSSPHSETKKTVQDKDSEPFLLTDDLLLGLQKVIQLSKGKVQVCSDEYKLDKLYMNDLLSDLETKKRKIEEQETKIAKIFQQLLAARKLKKIFVNSLQDTKAKVTDFEQRMDQKLSRIKAVEHEAVEGEKVLSLAKKELLKQRLRRMRAAAASNSPRDGSPLNSEVEVTYEGKKESGDMDDEDQVWRNKQISATVKKLKNRLSYLTTNLTKVEGQITPKQVTRKRKSAEHHQLTTLAGKKKVKNADIGTSRMGTVSTEPSTVQSQQEIANEKARLMKLERELAMFLNRLASEKRENTTVTSMGKSTSQGKDELQKDAEGLRKDGQELRKEGQRMQINGESGGIGLERSRQAGDKPMSGDDQRQQQGILDFLKDEEKLSRLQKIYSEKLEMADRIRSSSLFSKFEGRQEPSCSCHGSFTFGRDDQSLNIRRKSNVEASKESALIPLSNYKSVLAMFRSYRLCPFFRSKENLRLSSNTYSNKISARDVVCPFDLDGKCLDDSCKRQHASRVFTMTFNELLLDLLMYDPSKAKEATDSRNMDKNSEYIESFIAQYQGKIGSDDTAVLLLNEVRLACQSQESKLYNVLFDKRTFNRSKMEFQQERNAGSQEREDREHLTAEKLYNIDTKKVKREQNRIALLKEMELAESQEVRYFAESYNCEEELETVLRDQPHEVSLWISLAQFHRQGGKEAKSSTETQRDKALNALARGLDQNTDSEELWMHYLSLFSESRNYEDVRSNCLRASQCATSFKVNWLCLELLKTYNDKRGLCYSMIDMLCKLDESSELKNSRTSHQIVETLCYFLNMTISCGKINTAKRSIFEALAYRTTENNSVLTNVSKAITNCDKSFLWLMYMYVNECNELPSALFDSKKGGLSRIVSRKHFEIPFTDLQVVNVKETRTYFEEALKYTCPSHSETCYGACRSVIENFLTFELLVSEKSKLLDLFKDHPEILPEDPKLCSTYFLIQSELLPEEETLEVGKDLLTLSCYHYKMVYVFCSWLMKTGRNRQIEDTLSNYLLTKYENQQLSGSSRCYPDVCVRFKRLLGQYVGVLGKLPDVAVECSPTSEEYLYCWLNFCLYLDVSGDPSRRSSDVLSAFESAVTSYTTMENRKTLWIHYFKYQLKHLKEEDTTGFARLMESLQRSLVSVPYSCTLPWDHSQSYNSYNFQNEVIQLCLPVISQSTLPAFYQSMLGLMGDNVELGTRVCKFEFERGNVEQAQRIYGSMLPIAPQYLDLWKVAISIEASKKCYKEVRWLYQEAVKSLPFCSSLWKEYALFEIAHGKDTTSKDAALKGIFKATPEYGVEVEDFVRKVIQ